MAQTALGGKRSRVVIFMIAAALLGVPAAALHALCVGRSCDSAASASDQTPFCSLPPDVRTAMGRGFYDGRGGEIVAVSDALIEQRPTRTANALLWPSISSQPPLAPVILSGTGVAPSASLPPGTGLDDVAPTIAEIIDLDRPHASVRSGTLIEEVLGDGGVHPRLVLEVVWRGVDPEVLETGLGDLPNLESLVESGATTFSAESLSLPHDPAAVITTIGTGGLPSEHGITGERLRSDRGSLTTAWGQGSPTNVIATLGDHLDELTHNRALIAGVGGEASDRGVIGGRWYPGGDRDTFALAPTTDRQVTVATNMLREGRFGDDDVVDLLGVVQEGSARDLDAALGELVAEARRAAGDSLLIVVTGTGAPPSGSSDLSSAAIGRRIERSVDGRDEVIEEARLGAFFLDQDVLARRKLSSDVVLEPLLALRDGGKRVFADVFPAVAVGFGRYCDG